MCGIIGLLLSDPNKHCNQLLFDGLTVLQHRGQDAAGMVTSEPYHETTSNNNSKPPRLHLRKENGLVKDVFMTHHMYELKGNVGLGHCRYPTAGSSSCAEAQPLYTNYPHGICVAHNGNVTNTEELSNILRTKHDRHINTDSDSELLLNLFAELLTHEKMMMQSKSTSNDNNNNMKESIFAALTNLMLQCHGGYAGLYLINGYGLVGFRDPHGIRPLVYGIRRSNNNGEMEAKNGNQQSSSSLDYVICSESVAIDTLGFQLVRDVRAGEAIYIDMDGQLHSRVVHPKPNLSPCIFEYVYFARPDSIMDGVSVYETRLLMGEKLAKKIQRTFPDDHHDIDVVIPIPDTSRTSALQAAYQLNVPFREGFIKNRYIARTFIMPGQATRRKSVRLKLNTIKAEFANKNVLLVDDSIVRGTTAHEIVQMARDAGARKVFFCSAAPPIRYPNIYGIDIPTRKELVAYNRNEEEIAKEIGCDWVLYQDLADLEDSVKEAVDRMPQQQNGNRKDTSSFPAQFDSSCFSGQYVTGEKIGDDYFTKLHELRNDDAKKKRERGGGGGGSSDGDGNNDDDDDINNNSSHKAVRRRSLQSNDGCETLSNDKTAAQSTNANSCETLTNQTGSGTLTS